MSAQPKLQPVASITPRMSWDDYLAIRALNFSRLKPMGTSPLEYRHQLQHGGDSDTFRLGRAAHCAVLEPHRFSTDFAIWDRRSSSDGMAPRKGQYWEAFKADHPGQTIISPDDELDALTMQRAIRSNPVAMKYLAFGDPEVTLQWTIRGRPMKGRIDWLTQIDGKYVLVGLKTAADIRLREFSNHAGRLLYHWQWAMYFDGFEAIHGRQPQVVEHLEGQDFVVDTNPRVVEIVVCKKAPHDVVVYTIPDEVLQKGRDEYLLAIQRLEECERDDYWPGVAPLEQRFTLPSWMQEREDNLSDLGLEA